MVVGRRIEDKDDKNESKPTIIADEIKNNAYSYEKSLGKWTNAEIETDMRTSGSPTQNYDSLHVAIRPVLYLAQCFSVLPVNGVSAPDASGLKFTWRSFKILYIAITLGMSLSLTVASIVRLISSEFHTTKMTTLVFSSTTSLSSLMFLRLATKWPDFAGSWDKIERELATRHRRPAKFNLSQRFKTIVGIIMTLALVEHLLSIVSGYMSACECAKFRNDSNIAAVYFKTQFPQIFNKTSYALWKGIILQSNNIISTFLWNITDLFLILLSTALTYHFSQLNERLNSVKNKAMPEWWWAEARIDYNNLANLTRQVDSNVATIILLSFGTDLYFICLQLMYSFDRMTTTMRTIYFCSSFGFLLGRTTAVSLSAASVHDESILPAPILYSVKASSYSTEVMRFLNQVTTDFIGLTGMKFFAITRGFVLTVAGTIVTYELVLVQFNAVQQSTHLNLTDACEYEMEFEWHV